jgi:DNA-directed RNA polymerase specialized sigma24 family protein
LNPALRHSQIQLDADVLETLALRSQQMQQRESDRAAALRECLTELTKRNRVVIKSYYGGRSVADIAKARDATPNAIYKLLDRTRAVLHQCVSNRLATEGAT